MQIIYIYSYIEYRSLYFLAKKNNNFLSTKHNKQLESE